MQTPEGNVEIGRRDWLKTAALAGTAALAATSARAQSVTTPPIAITNTSGKKVRGVVFMVSDGMSPGVITMAEAFSQLTRQKTTAWWTLLKNPLAASGIMDTASANSLVTDSAAASSAWGSGQRVNNAAINVTPDGKKLTPIAAILKPTGARIGLVSTATITHATPAGFASSVPNRGQEHDIAPQYLDLVDVILGGGIPFFDPKSRPDQRDLFADFEKSGYGLVRDRDALLASKSEKLLGVFTNGHLPYEVDRVNDETLAARIPSLAEMSEAALSRFLPGEKPFLLQIEAARIDHAAHLNDIAGLLGDQIAFDDAVAKVLELIGAREDILVVVTSDHGNANPGLRGMGGSYSETNKAFARVAEMKASHERLFADWNRKPGTPSDLAALVKTKLGVSLKDDQAAELHEAFQRRPITEWNEQLSNPEGILGQLTGNRTGIGWVGTTHTADPTLISAIGPQSQRFHGLVKNTDVFTHLVEMLGQA